MSERVSVPPPGHEERSLGELFSDLTTDVSILVRQEVALAKAELRESGKNAGAGIGMLVGAGVAGLLFLIFISNAAWAGLTNVVGATWAAVIVALVWAVIAGILAAVGRSKLNKVEGVPQTTETVKQIPNALKGNEEENR